MLFSIPLACSLALGSSASVLSGFPINGRWSNAANETSPDTIGQSTNGTAPENPLPGGVLVCLDVDWQACNHTVLILGTCYDLRENWNNTISSIGPDNGTVILTFQEENCAGNRTAWVYPGSANLIADGWNDEIVSLKAVAFT
ncbi:hypothetical protein BU17DRAFT_92799 [Hysterangium stoloniferum]|nr:hypothetical protein BU17DRAFT_92799 [Hysterangium stoloniferum]